MVGKQKGSVAVGNGVLWRKDFVSSSLESVSLLFLDAPLLLYRLNNHLYFFNKLQILQLTLWCESALREHATNVNTKF